MADNAQFFIDTREPHIGADFAAVTLLTTDLPLYTTAQFPALGNNYFGRVGKKLHIRLFGKITTAATPGNGTWDIYYGTGAAANGILLTSSIAQTLIASQTNQSWQLDIYVRCVTTGATGTLEVTGSYDFTPAVVATGGGLIPASGAGPSAACDLSSANMVSCQFKRSGSTAETMAVQDMEICPMN